MSETLAAGALLVAMAVCGAVGLAMVVVPEMAACEVAGHSGSQRTRARRLER